MRRIAPISHPLELTVRWRFISQILPTPCPTSPLPPLKQYQESQTSVYFVELLLWGEGKGIVARLPRQRENEEACNTFALLEYLDWIYPFGRRPRHQHEHVAQKRRSSTSILKKKQLLLQKKKSKYFFSIDGTGEERGKAPRADRSAGVLLYVDASETERDRVALSEK